MKYFAIFDKNVETVFQLQWKIGNISDMFLQYSVLYEQFISIRIIIHSGYCLYWLSYGFLSFALSKNENIKKWPQTETESQTSTFTLYLELCHKFSHDE